MKISTKTQFGLRILLHIAMEDKYSRLAQGKEIAAKQGINEPYLEQIMITLKNAGMVSTVRGRNGGYQLAKQPHEITLMDILENFEGTLELQSDGVESPEAKAGERIWDGLITRIRNATAKVTLAQIIEENLHRMPDYVI